MSSTAQGGSLASKRDRRASQPVLDHFIPGICTSCYKLIEGRRQQHPRRFCGLFGQKSPCPGWAVCSLRLLWDLRNQDLRHQVPVPLLCPALSPPNASPRKRITVVHSGSLSLYTLGGREVSDDPTSLGCHED